MTKVLCIKDSDAFDKGKWYDLANNFYIKQKDGTYRRSAYSVYPKHSLSTIYVNFNEKEFNENFLTKEQLRDNKLNSILG